MVIYLSFLDFIDLLVFLFLLFHEMLTAVHYLRDRKELLIRRKVQLSLGFSCQIFAGLTSKAFQCDTRVAQQGFILQELSTIIPWNTCLFLYNSFFAALSIAWFSPLCACCKLVSGGIFLRKQCITEENSKGKLDIMLRLVIKSCNDLQMNSLFNMGTGIHWLTHMVLAPARLESRKMKVIPRHHLFGAWARESTGTQGMSGLFNAPAAACPPEPVITFTH